MAMGILGVTLDTMMPREGGGFLSRNTHGDPSLLLNQLVVEETDFSLDQLAPNFKF